MSAWGAKKNDDQYDEPEVDYDFQPEVRNPVQMVQLDGLVLLKMIKHCTEKVPEVVTGQLLGLDVGEKLEVTNCFAGSSDDKDDEVEEHQLEMMKNFRAVNIDNNTVGWYQSALLGSWLHASIIENQYSYQKEIPNSVVVVYDPFRTNRGRLALKAYRLTNEFMQLHESGDLSHMGFSKFNVDSTNIFEEIPIKVHNSHLVHGFLYELRENKSMSCEFDRLNLSAGPFLEKSLGTLSSIVDEYASEQSKFQYVQRLIARQKAQQAAVQSKRAAENEQRANLGQDPLDEDGKGVKITPQPSRLETFLLANQLSNYCEQIESASQLNFNKLYITEALKGAKAKIERILPAQ